MKKDNHDNRSLRGGCGPFALVNLLYSDQVCLILTHIARGPLSCLSTHLHICYLAPGLQCTDRRRACGPTGDRSEVHPQAPRNLAAADRKVPATSSQVSRRSKIIGGFTALRTNKTLLCVSQAFLPRTARATRKHPAMNPPMIFNRRLTCLEVDEWTNEPEPVLTRNIQTFDLHIPAVTNRIPRPKRSRCVLIERMPNVIGFLPGFFQ